jgi:hypothetical protein
LCFGCFRFCSPSGFGGADRQRRRRSPAPPPTARKAPLFPFPKLTSDSNQHHTHSPPQYKHTHTHYNPQNEPPVPSKSPNPTPPSEKKKAVALASREHQLLTAATLQDDLAQRRAALAVLEGGGGAASSATAAGRRAEELRRDVARLELSCAAARREYNRLAEINRAELRRTAGERAGELGCMLEGLAATQAAASEQALEAWLALAGELRCDPRALAPLRAALTTTGAAAGGF